MARQDPPRSPDRATLVAAYVRHAAAKRGEDFWARDAVDEVVFGTDAEAAWDLVVELLRGVADDDLGYVAAGPLEDTVRRHGVALVDWIEGEARRDARFRWALGRIWMAEGELPAEIQRCIVAASGGDILVLERRGSP